MKRIVGNLATHSYRYIFNSASMQILPIRIYLINYDVMIYVGLSVYGVC